MSMSMRKTIHRRVEWSPEDLKKALVEWLQDRDQPYPNGSETSFEFKLTEDGATVAWTEVY
jgi:hypothetical protein